MNSIFKIKFRVIGAIASLLFIGIADNCSMNTKVKNMIFNFPKLTGQYNVGETKRYIIDQNRKEPHNLSASRELMVYFWYPVDKLQNADKKPNLYCAEDIEKNKQAFKQLGFADAEIKSLDYVYTSVSPEARPLYSNAPYPVVFFSHGYLGCGPRLYTAFCEELASHGYIVASIAHTYYAQSVTFPDGHVIEAASEKFKQTEPSKEDQELWITDVHLALNALKEFNTDKNDMLFGLFNFNKIGMLGHSFGGSTAFYLCLQDPNFKAGIDLDNLLLDDVDINDLRKPFLFILSESLVNEFKSTDEEIKKKYSENFAKTFSLDIEKAHKIIMKSHNKMKNNFQKLIKSKELQYIVIPGIEHSGFSDLLILKEMAIHKKNKQLLDLDSITGPAEGFETISNINEHIVKFFDKNLKYGS